VAEGGNNEFPTLDELERKHILAVLEHCKGNRTHAARLLNVSIRTLRNKLHEYNGTSPQAEEEEAELSAAKA
jgi:DNA-binding NtrC family response regulator